jgi:hypothetical protein
VNPTAIRWASLFVFGGAGLAAAGGLVLMFLRREPGVIETISRVRSCRIAVRVLSAERARRSAGGA